MSVCSRLYRDTFWEALRPRERVSSLTAGGGAAHSLLLVETDRCLPSLQLSICFLIAFVGAGCGQRGTKGVFYESLLVSRGGSLVCAIAGVWNARYLVSGMRAYFNGLWRMKPEWGPVIAARRPDFASETCFGGLNRCRGVWGRDKTALAVEGG